MRAPRSQRGERLRRAQLNGQVRRGTLRLKRSFAALSLDPFRYGPQLNARTPFKSPIVLFLSLSHCFCVCLYRFLRGSNAFLFADSPRHPAGHMRAGSSPGAGDDSPAPLKRTSAAGGVTRAECDLCGGHDGARSSESIRGRYGRRASQSRRDRRCHCSVSCVVRSGHVRGVASQRGSSWRMTPTSVCQWKRA